MNLFVFKLLGLVGRTFRYMGRKVLDFSGRFNRNENSFYNIIQSTRYDMVTSNDEPFYAHQYFNILSEHFELLPEFPEILDLGCGQGRMTLYLAAHLPKASLLGCDVSREAITSARRYAEMRGLKNVNFKVESISKRLRDIQESSIDLVLMTEVSFFYPEWKQDIAAIVASLKPGGLFVVSLRSQYFDALFLVKNHMWESLDMLQSSRTGPIFENEVNYSWQTSTEARQILEEENLKLIDIRGIGVCSGIPGDPHEEICRPSDLTDGERDKLMKLELELGRHCIDSGRYILAIARK